MKEEYDMFVKFGSWDHCGSTEFLLLQPQCGTNFTVITMSGCDYGGGVDEILEVEPASYEELGEFYELLKIEDDEKRKYNVIFWCKMIMGLFKPLTEEEKNLYKDFKFYGSDMVLPTTEFEGKKYFLQNYWQTKTLVWEKCK